LPEQPAIVIGTDAVQVSRPRAQPEPVCGNRRPYLGHIDLPTRPESCKDYDTRGGEWVTVGRPGSVTIFDILPRLKSGDSYGAQSDIEPD
jgi:hypothetical protein